MDSETIALNLRLMADKNKREADFFTLAASLHEVGYQTDTARIETEKQPLKDRITVLTALLVDNNIEVPQ